LNKYFVGIGAAKAGTHWLAKYFKHHPEVCFSPIKELHYFDLKFIDFSDNPRNFPKNLLIGRIEKMKKLASKLNEKLDENTIYQLKQMFYLIEMYKNHNAYHQYFDILKKNNEKICGEITPNYSMLPKEGFIDMKKKLNNPKILIILRNPVDRLWSQVRFHKRFYPDINFNNYYINSFDKRYIIQLSKYDEILTLLFKIFDSKNILIIFFEHLFNENFKEASLKLICDFIGVTYISSTVKEKINASISVQLNNNLRLLGIQKLLPTYKFVLNTFENTPQNWLDDFNRVS